MLIKNDRPEGGWLVKCDGCGNEILAELFPYRKGNIYSKEGRRREIEENPMDG